MSMIYGNAYELIDTLDTGSVQLGFTSPPYYGQREYGDRPGDEIGWGSPADYLGMLGKMLDALHRVIDDEGSCWWVIGDKASGSGGAGGDHLRKGSKHWIPAYGKAVDDIAPGQWMLMPYRFAVMAQDKGWLVRSMIVWDKSPNVKPEDPDHIHRPMVSTERIILLTKQVQCRWFPKRLVEPADVWHVKPHRGARAERHYAPFPAELPRRAILATTSRGDQVLDVFAGTGTTVNVATDLGRQGVGFELYPPAPQDRIGR
jgi:DNA modification methylase